MLQAIRDTDQWNKKQEKVEEVPEVVELEVKEEKLQNASEKSIRSITESSVEQLKIIIPRELKGHISSINFQPIN